MEETHIGYVTEMGVATHNKGRLTCHRRIVLVLLGRYVGIERMYHGF